MLRVQKLNKFSFNDTKLKNPFTFEKKILERNPIFNISKELKKKRKLSKNIGRSF